MRTFLRRWVPYPLRRIVAILRGRVRKPLFWQNAVFSIDAERLDNGLVRLFVTIGRRRETIDTTRDHVAEIAGALSQAARVERLARRS